MRLPLFIYVHGFNSSPQSIKAQLLKAYLLQNPHEGEYMAPALSHWPNEAIKQIEALIEAAADRPVVLVGSSLGGFYSINVLERFSNCRAVLVNPAIYPYRLLADWLGDNENIYTQEHYMLTREHLGQLEQLAVTDLKAPERYLVLLQTADETLDYREAESYFSQSPLFIQSGGSHGFDQFETLIPAIIRFSEGVVDLPSVLTLSPHLSDRK